MAEFKGDGGRRYSRQSDARRGTSSSQGRPQGTRFKTTPNKAAPTPGARRAPAHTAAHHHGVQPVYRRQAAAQKRSTSPVPVVIGIVALVAIIALVVLVAIPAVQGLFAGEEASSVEAGVEVQVNIPEGASGDQIASILSQNHIIENPKEYYATVRDMHADSQLKPGDYRFTTLQDPREVIQQLIDGPNVQGISLTIPEGLTVEQTAERVQSTFGISTDDFMAQAKASNYAADYPFLEGAYNDSLEGYLYPKTYTFQVNPTADEVIRALLDQFAKETADLSLDGAPDGLTAQQVVTLASLVERESSVEDERPTIASVIYNRLDVGMPLQIDAAIVYARGGGSDPVTYDDLKIDSPYNLYEHTGLTPGPICSPSISSIKAALAPADTDYLYYVLSASRDGTHAFSETYDEFLANKNAYSESVS